MRRRGSVAFLVLLVACTFVEPAHAATTFTVNSTSDPGTGTCDATECTLREAIIAANALGGADTIAFAINGSGVHTITPSSPLPSISSPVDVDGYSQPGATPNTLSVGDDALLKIELNGHNAGFVVGLSFIEGSGGSSVRGLVIRDWFANAINASDPFGFDGLTVAGNFLGTDVTGTIAAGNFRGVQSNRLNNGVIGGPNPADRNVIAGNRGEGMSIQQGTNLVVENNYIGTAKDGTTRLGNGGHGISTGTEDTSVRNNVIAFNSQAEDAVAFSGVSVDDNGNNVAILSNRIFRNRGIGIDLGSDGRTRNDAQDADIGANDLQNTPVIKSVKTRAGITTVKGTLATLPPGSYTVQFFENTRANRYQGQKVIGEQIVSVPAQGEVAFTKTFAALPLGRFITTTATSPDGDTSEFSLPVKNVRS